MGDEKNRDNNRLEICFLGRCCHSLIFCPAKEKQWGYAAEKRGCSLTILLSVEGQIKKAAKQFTECFWGKRRCGFWWWKFVQFFLSPQKLSHSLAKLTRRLPFVLDNLSEFPTFSPVSSDGDVQSCGVIWRPPDRSNSVRLVVDGLAKVKTQNLNTF